MQGTAYICQITNIQFNTEDPSKDPRLEVEFTSDDDEVKKQVKVVDIGQVTTVWVEGSDYIYENDCRSQTTIQEYQDVIDLFPVGFTEFALDRLYQGRVGRSRSSKGALTKKQVKAIVDEAPACSAPSVERIMRSVLKTGRSYARLVDSGMVTDHLFDNKSKLPKSLRSVSEILKRAASAVILAMDSDSSGRFKRLPSMLVSHDSSSISLINGGWLVLDQSVRAGSEARKFAERDLKSQSVTMADERIAQRLECLAMGQDISSFEGEHANTLELDIRETLKAMDLPLTRNGAKEALIRTGRWTKDDEASSGSKAGINPWSKSILDAVEWYRSMDKERRKKLYQIAVEKHGSGDIEDRVDLTSLPAVCVDAKGTSFRDDAIGVRPRSVTGRKIAKNASKWEILIHIADVSDIYAPEAADTILRQKQELLERIRQASENRGASRYDLPIGPLHLLPPSLLEVLSLDSYSPDLTSRNSPRASPKATANRAVTIWAYIDERNGKLLDAGVERTLISETIALSYASASSLLDGSYETNDDALIKARAILRVVERNVGLWSEHHRSQNEKAQAREKRLAAKEKIGKLSYGSNSRDDGTGGFQRTRGHRLVDNCLGLYAYAAGGLLRRAKAPIPRVAGNGPERQGRIATAPLRRYVDGVAQRQLLAVLCNYGGPPMTKDQCIEAGKAATKAINSIATNKSIKLGRRATVSKQQRQTLRPLLLHLKGGNKPIPAVSTGNPGEVIVLGIGALASCRGIQGTLAPGTQVMVRIQEIDEQKGTVSVRFTGY